jgi:hypothetical protein
MRHTTRLRLGIAACGVLLAVSACSAQTTDGGDAGGSQASSAAVDPALRAKAAVAPVLVLVHVRDDAARAELAEAARAAGIALVDPWEEDPVVRLQVDAAQLDAILATGLVESIVEEPQLQTQ